ncbi:HAMP domain-containing sensor histidine kinase [Pseudoduganella ginsengisoli]|uniref:histidine kinase n=1 Tax=Pseudoduganella ginsengisoli TaxID=1462440 RepID=A0A6L6PZK8_9BURK|nr:ATP-binding protein [Pseudoduganella ginsengisoli]MTW02780.1 two-component sensor histidine kinase [Pseudoduganella ginsengisoli]
MFPELSFRQLSLGVFVLIAALLGATSVHALLTLDRLAAHSREAGRHAVALAEQVQRLSERGVAMERSARQFLVLDDPAFRDRYADAWREAQSALATIGAGLPSSQHAALADWRARGEAVAAVLQSVPATRERRSTAPARRALGQTLDRALAGLPAVSQLLEDAVRHEVERRNQVLLDELDQRRRLLTTQVAVAVALAALLALGGGAWLSRPLKQIEQAIVRLGGNRYDETIAVQGPGDLRRLGTQLDWLRKRLAEVEADKARFVRHVSHELKTPLAALVEGVSLLEDEVPGPLSRQQREIAAILRQNTLSLQAQIEDLLRFNEAGFAAQRLRRTTTDPGVLLDSVIAAQRLQCQARHVHCAVEGQVRPLLLDADLMAAALGNLLSNALRFSPQGGAVHFSLSEAQGKLHIDCRDEGPGVAPQDSERIFEPFYQGERQPASARRGNGIGLAIVREYVHAHGGALRLMPSERGAHFQIELPYDD